MSNLRAIYTIGHSTHPLEEFLEMLQHCEIRTLVDIRRLPGSRKYPQYDQDNLQESLQKSGIRYVYAEDLGGRRKPAKDSKNTRWKNASFQGYADYMETPEFAAALERLEKTALSESTAYMCAEAVWWRCHRALVSDVLKAKGWTVFHIMAKGKTKEHAFTPPASVKDGRLTYSE